MSLTKQDYRNQSLALFFSLLICGDKSRYDAVSHQRFICTAGSAGSWKLVRVGMREYLIISEDRLSSKVFYTWFNPNILCSKSQSICRTRTKCLEHFLRVVSVQCRSSRMTPRSMHSQSPCTIANHICSVTACLRVCCSWCTHKCNRYEQVQVQCPHLHLPWCLLPRYLLSWSCAGIWMVECINQRTCGSLDFRWTRQLTEAATFQMEFTNQARNGVRMEGNY